MEPAVRPIPSAPSQSFAVRHLRGENCNIPYHVHDAHEIILIQAGSGSFYVGNTVRRFESGDVFLLAPGVPHWFRCEKRADCNSNRDEFIVLQFYKSFLGEGYFELPEHARLARLMDTPDLALGFEKHTANELTEFLLSLPYALQQARFLLVLRILALLGNTSAFVPLDQQVSLGIRLLGDDRLAKLHDYVMSEFRNSIYVEDVAALINMTVPTFCRFFKQHTGTTLMDFVQEVRIEHACTLLRDTPLNLQQVCAECGLHSISHFIRLFKRFKGMTPQSFRTVFK